MGGIALRPLCPVGQQKPPLHRGIGIAGSTLGSEVNKELSLWQKRACQAPGTTQLCKRIFPEDHRTEALQLKPARLRRGRNPNQIPAAQRKSPQPDQTPRAMPLKLGERYVCQNPLCKSEIEVTRPSTDTARNPTCGCGGPMKKPYRRPQLRELPGQPLEFAFAVEQERGV